MSFSSSAMIVWRTFYILPLLRCMTSLPSLQLLEFSSPCTYICVGPLGKSAPEPDVPSNWRSALVACGSNAFGQNTDGEY